MVFFPCVKCFKHVRPRQHAVACDSCGRWQHRICDTGISLDMYREAVRSGDGLSFVCHQCVERIPPMDVPDPTPVISELGLPVSEQTIDTESEHIQKIRLLKYELCETQFYKESASKLKTFIADKDVRPHGEDGGGLDIVCYGIGSFMESYISRYQLALLLALREDFLIADGCCEVYDPKFTADEVKLLSELSFNVLDINQEGKRQCKSDHMTMFYMPHCGKALYNNLLWRNWGPQLENIVLIGNSFTHMLDSTPGRILEKTANYVIKIHPYTKEIPLQIPFAYDDVFNDTSIHVFLHDTNTPVPVKLWEDNSEPVYDNDDAEIIFR